MNTQDAQGPEGAVDDLSDNAFFAHAALFIQSRQRQLSVPDAVEYLYGVADDIGVDGVELARVILQASHGRGSPRSAAYQEAPLAPQPLN